MQAPRRSRLTAWGTVVLLGLLLGACGIGDTGGDLPQDALNPTDGSVAQTLDRLWNYVFPIAVAVFVLVEGLLLFVLFRFRARGDETELPKQVAGNTKLEIGWTAAPAVVLALIAVPTVGTIFALSEVGADPIHVRVIAKQYFWEFEYLDPDEKGVVTATQLHIPVNRPVQLDMQSVSAQVTYNPVAVQGEVEGVAENEQPRGQVAQGVIHSFWVPRLAGKQDVIPGHTRRLVLQTAEEGLYLGQCAEFCGLSHANMKLSVVAESPESFEAWINSQAAAAQPAEGGDVAEGEELFTTKTCVGCHAIEGYPDPETGERVPVEEQARIGPNLTHFNSRPNFAGGIFENNDDALERWLRNPPEVKPGAQMPNLQLTDDEISSLIAYLRSLD